jgi:hypothetical protein
MNSYGDKQVRRTVQRPMFEATHVAAASTPWQRTAVTAGEARA